MLSHYYWPAWWCGDVVFCLVDSTAPGKTLSTVSPSSKGPNLQRGTQARNTFHGKDARRVQPPTFNGPGAAPSHTVDTSAMGPGGGRPSFFNRITQKFSRRSVLLINFFFYMSLEKVFFSLFSNFSFKKIDCLKLFCVSYSFTISSKSKTYNIKYRFLIWCAPKLLLIWNKIFKKIFWLIINCFYWLQFTFLSF